MTSPTELPVSADELREGDRVRVTFEGVISGSGWFKGDGGPDLTPSELAEVGTITRLPKPLEEGDHVKIGQGVDGVILSIRDDLAWIRYDGGGYTTAELSSLTRIEQES